MMNCSRRVTLVSLACITLGACGLSADIHPRDIDPVKQDLLQLPTTTTTTTPTDDSP